MKWSTTLFFIIHFFSSSIWASSSSWVEEQLSKMTLEEKIGQLFVAPLAPLQSESHWKDWEKLEAECHVGNVLMKAADASSQIQVLNRLQKLCRLPLLVTADAEWGLGMRMMGAISFPKNLTLGAIQNLSLIEEMGRSIGKQAKEVGIHLNLAPVADVNVNPMNPIIHMRSFGQNPMQVSKRCVAIICGMHQENILTCAKHFPGHGDTFVDSHYFLPVIEKSLNDLENCELIPFQAAIDAGVDCIMTGHLLLLSLDSDPATLSKNCLNLLRHSMGFQKLIVTDALNMKALTNHYSVEEIAIKAFMAGHDLLLYGAHVYQDVDDLMQNQIPRAFRALKNAFLTNELSLSDLDERVRRILQIKEHLRPIPQSCPDSILDPVDLALKKTLYREALTLIGHPVPIFRPFVYLAIGGKENDWMVKKMIEMGIEIKLLDLQEKTIPTFHQPIVVGLHQVKRLGGDFGLSDELIDLLQHCDHLIFFCTPYALALLHPHRDVVIAYENDPDAQEAAFDYLQNRLLPCGHLPISLDD